MKEYSYFGEEDIIKKGPRSFSAVCINDCEFYTLDKIEMETIIKEEYPLLYEKLVTIVAQKGKKDLQTKKDLLQIYKKFDKDIDENKFDNTLSVQDMKLMDDVPTLEELYEEAIVYHPVEVLLNSFNSENYRVEDDPYFQKDSKKE